ncbi:MAG: MFS transporter [Chloroflexi bacterium]|nr:MFS transporter [Chloroflexota bacterium]
MLNSPEQEIQKRNFRYVQIDGIGVSIANVAAPFLPVFLARLGASNFQVGLLTSMPGVTGLILAILVGRFLQSRKNIVPWYSLSRLMVISCYALTGLLTIALSNEYVVVATLAIWAFATLPQTSLAVAFSVVMNAVAGPEGRYALLSRRWAIFGLTTVVMTFFVTRTIDLIDFPYNYSVMFLGLSVGGLISFYFSRKIKVPDQTRLALGSSSSALESARSYFSLIRGAPAFTSFALKKFVYYSALMLSQPIMPLFFVREVKATDSQIGTITMAMNMVMLAGYFLWSWSSRKYGGRFVLLATTFGMILYPALTAATPQVPYIIAYAAIAGLFQAGLDLVFFDELMKTVPSEYSATFVSLVHSMQYLSAIVAPLLGIWLADYIGLGGALWASAGLRLIGFLLFLKKDVRRAAESV